MEIQSTEYPFDHLYDVSFMANKIRILFDGPEPSGDSSQLDLNISLAFFALFSSHYVP